MPTLQKVSSALLALSLVSGEFAQQQAPTPSPAARPASATDVQKAVDNTMTNMAPMMGKMTEMAIESQLTIGERPETAARIATFKKNLYDALVKHGFTADQALQIIIGTPVPGMANSR